MKITFTLLLLIFATTIHAQGETPDKKPQDHKRFLSAGYNTGYAVSRMFSVERGGVAAGITIGGQINCEIVSLFQGDLSAELGFRNIGATEFYFYDDQQGEMREYEFISGSTIFKLNLRWSPKGEFVPYFEAGSYYSDMGD